MVKMSEDGIKINVVEEVFVNCLDQEYMDGIKEFQISPNPFFRSLSEEQPAESLSAGQKFTFKVDKDENEDQ